MGSVLLYVFSLYIQRQKLQGSVSAFRIRLSCNSAASLNFKLSLYLDRLLQDDRLPYVS